LVPAWADTAAVASILLVSGYVTLIPLAGWGVYWLASTYGVLSGAALGVRAVVVSSALILSGCLMILSLFKPLLAHPVAATEPQALDREQESLMYAFVRELASTLGAPEPSRIAIDCNVNAVASSLEASLVSSTATSTS
jgi:hypothetical protein